MNIGRLASLAGQYGAQSNNSLMSMFNPSAQQIHHKCHLAQIKTQIQILVVLQVPAHSMAVVAVQV